MAHFQRLLREPPGTLVGGMIDTETDALQAQAPLAEVTRHLASYNLVAAPVVDPTGRLLGAVTVDDVLDHLLPQDWREHDFDPSVDRVALHSRSVCPWHALTAGAPGSTSRGCRAVPRCPRRTRTRSDGCPSASRASWAPASSWSPRPPSSSSGSSGTSSFRSRPRFDAYPFQFLTLVLSLQAAYAAPLILLAQNRQDDRDRANLAQDRDQNAMLTADAEYLTREVASLRVALGDVVTRDFLRAELRALLEEFSGPERRFGRDDRGDRPKRKRKQRASRQAKQDAST